MAKKDAAAADARDNFQIITDGLQRYGGAQKATSDSRFICCPLPEHGGDNTPSLGIYMEIEGKIPLGYWHCFGCAQKGRWNDLAKIIDADPIKEWQKSSDVAANLITHAVEESLLGESGTTFKYVLEQMRCKEARRWPVAMAWRGFSGQLVHDVGGHIINDARKDSVGVLFPVKIGGKVRGGIKAVYEREGKEIAYINMGGNWTLKYGLFPYMYAAKMIKRQSLRFLFLVEGPRDAMRLVSLGIPAMAILGATSMSDVKTLLILNLDITHVYVVTDNDAGGDVMWKSVRKFIKKHDSVKLKRMQLPKNYDKKDKLIKMDPGNMPQNIVDDVLSVLKTTHKFKPQPTGAA